MFIDFDFMNFFSNLVSEIRKVNDSIDFFYLYINNENICIATY